MKKKCDFRPFLPSAFPIRKCRRVLSSYTRLSVRLALPQGPYRVPYQYRGHLSHKKSLIGIFRQVMMINRDKIVRFGEKFEKKIFATTFFRTEICPCLSEIKKSPSVKFLRAAGLVRLSWHTWPVSTNENRENRPPTKLGQATHAQWSRHIASRLRGLTESLSRICSNLKPSWSK